ncbi:MAG: hypothetical protein J7M27_04030 [Candidatus Latescibacteria bacterium]|nr:hypothetical protein [Candidatus Latescibacterota bacterium]
MMPFGEVLEVADKLSLNEQETLIEVLRRRIIDRRREGLAKEIQLAQQEFQAGRCRPVTSAELMKEIVS